MPKNYALEVEDLSITFESANSPDVKALDHVSLKVEAGDFFALLGPNGAGKSTMINAITTLVKFKHGDIKIFNRSLKKDEFLIKQDIGVVPQEFNFNIFETVEQIIINQAGYYGIPRKVAVERTKEYLEKLDLYGKRNTQSMNLSGGMKRRLMIARALIHEPRLLILDEPTAGVDIELRRTMWDFLIDLNKKGVTIILTTHYLEEAENLCRNIAIIDHGKIIKHMTMNNLLQQLTKQVLVIETDCDANLSSLSCQVSAHENYFEVEVSPEFTINALFKELNENKIKVHSLRNKTNRLEELFVDIVQARS